MKLLIAIVKDEFSQNLAEALIDAKIRATKLSSTGGFLKKGNTTMLIGVEEEELVSVIALIRKHCKTSINSTMDDNEDVDERGANVFILDIDSHERM